MSFLGLLIIIFFIWLISPLIRTWLAVRKYRKKVNDVFRGKFSGQGDAFRHERNAGWSASERGTTKKIITKDMGEYVDFVEVTEISYQECRVDTDGKKTSVKTETQITDVKWEEIK